MLPMTSPFASAWPQREELHDRAGLVADHPGVVAWRDLERISGLDLALVAVVHADAEASRNDITDVRGLARLAAEHWLGMDRPSPATFKHGARHFGAVKTYKVRPSPRLLGAIEALDRQRWH